jgi:hypothetical protein
MGAEIFRFVTIRPPQQIAADSTTSVIDLGLGKSTSVYCIAVIITLAIISAAFGNLGPRPGPYFYTLEVV